MNFWNTVHSHLGCCQYNKINCSPSSQLCGPTIIQRTPLMKWYGERDVPNIFNYNEKRGGGLVVYPIFN